MTVKELIEELQKCDQDAQVFYWEWAMFGHREVNGVSEDTEGGGEVFLLPE